MNYYKLVVAYDGGAYSGWQAQKEVNSVAGQMQKTFSQIFHVPGSVRGASRTDAGVHALGQVAMLKTELEIKPEQLLYAWNNQLPSDIVIRSIEKVDERCNIYANIKHKVYYYHFFLERPLPFVYRYGWYYYYPVDLKKLEQCLATFVGTHDFKSFCSSEDTRENTVRTIDSITLEYFKRYGCYRIKVVGHSFLRHMVRRIVGACIEVASRPHLAVDVLNVALQEKNPAQLLPNAPANGLVLYKIVYLEGN